MFTLIFVLCVSGTLGTRLAWIRIIQNYGTITPWYLHLITSCHENAVHSLRVYEAKYRRTASFGEPPHRWRYSSQRRSKGLQQTALFQKAFYKNINLILNYMRLFNKILTM